MLLEHHLKWKNIFIRLFILITITYHSYVAWAEPKIQISFIRLFIFVNITYHSYVAWVKPKMKISFIRLFIFMSITHHSYVAWAEPKIKNRLPNCFFIATYQCDLRLPSHLKRIFSTYCRILYNNISWHSETSTFRICVTLWEKLLCWSGFWWDSGSSIALRMV